jgi:hypothetical protein
MLKLSVVVFTLMTCGCTSKLWQKEPETVVVTKREKISCDAEAMQKCEGVLIEDISNAFLGVEAQIQASTALDSCIDKHASLVNCIRRFNRKSDDNQK